MEPRDALEDLLFRLADDKLILGHRNSEWCGQGPVLEEDIAFASMAQDELGHALAYYTLLHQDFGHPDPDQLGFARSEADFRSCHFVEQPIGDYAFSLVRQFLAAAEQTVRLRALQSQEVYPALKELAKKIAREHKYHLLHGRTWVTQLGQGGADARTRMQTALDAAYPMAFGLFEPTPFTEALAAAGIQPTEAELLEHWHTELAPVLQQAGLHLAPDPDPLPYLGGRRGHHSEHLAPLLAEMREVFVLDPAATW